MVITEVKTDEQLTSLDFWVRVQGRWRLAGRQSVRSHGTAPDAEKAPSVPPPPDIGLEADRNAILREVELSNEAAIAHDPVRWRTLVTNDYISIDPDGKTRGADELAQDVKEGALTVLPPQEVSVRIYGNSAIVTSKTRPEVEHPHRGLERVTRVYQKVDGKWLRAAGIVTTVSDEP